MTKEELEKEAGKSWWNDNNCSGALSTKKIYICGYLAGAEPREKRIAEQGELLNSTLEENKDIYKKMADLDTALEDCTESLTDARIKIKELEKELEQAKKVQVVEHFEAYGQCRDSRRIAGLETENAELKDKLKNLESVAEVRLANWQKYEKENKELKEQNNKAKEIVRGLYFIIQGRIDYENNIAIADEMWRAKQFWKEEDE